MCKELKSVSLPSVTRQLDFETNESSSIFFVFLVCFSLFCPCACWCNCVSPCVNVYVCTCLFCLVVPTVLARKRSPPPRTHPGGVRLCRLGGGHHQQNISDLQCSTGTVAQEGHASNRKIICFGAKNKHYISVIGLSCSFSALLPIYS